MTPQELRQRRAGIVGVYSVDPETYDNNLPEILDKLDALDKEHAASKRKPEAAFYDHLNTLDADMRAYVGTQGDTAAELRLIETIQKHLSSRVKQLEKES